MSAKIKQVIPYLRVQNGTAAIQFYEQAFDAIERFRLTEKNTGRIGHAELQIGQSVVMLSDEYPEYGILGPRSLGGNSSGIHLQVENADLVTRQAVAAGAKITMELADQFYGERASKIEDPFGHSWMISHKITEVSPEEMQRRYDAMFEA